MAVISQNLCRGQSVLFLTGSLRPNAFSLSESACSLSEWLAVPPSVSRALNAFSQSEQAYSHSRFFAMTALLCTSIRTGSTFTGGMRVIHGRLAPTGGTNSRMGLSAVRATSTITAGLASLTTCHYTQPSLSLTCIAQQTIKHGQHLMVIACAGYGGWST